MAKIVNRFITKNPYFNDRKWISGSAFKGFMLHSVGVGQPDPLVFINSFNRSNYTNAGVNGFIGEDVIYITSPCLDTKGKVKRMPHGGKAASNNGYIGFEMCEPSAIKYTSGANFKINNKAAAQAYTKKVYANAVQLFAQLCTFHGKDPMTAIISHNEGGKRGVASGHVDPEHLWKGLGLSYTMDGFRKDVKKAMGGSTVVEKPVVSTEQIYRVRLDWNNPKTQIGAWKQLDKAKEQVKTRPEYKVYDESGKVVYEVAKSTSFLVKVTASTLNVRAGAGTSYKINTTIKKDEVYTIVEEKNGWGKLKSGAGWISLAYTTKA